MTFLMVFWCVIADVTLDDGDLLFDVAYVVGGRETFIEEKYIKSYEVESGRRRVQGRCR